MGSTPSKAARSLPKTSARAPPAWAGARTPGPSDPQLASHARQPLATIRQDSRDPHLLANLSRLGPVRVDHHMQTVRTQEADVSRLFNSRAQAEQDAAGANTPRNRLWGYALDQLLEERQSVGTREEQSQLAERYGMDAAKLESLARYVNTPSIPEGSIVRVIGKDGEEKITMTASWKEPSFVNDPSLRVR
ncbi:hypothetical protein FA95DRAFT_1588093 [Auriscalpium vulgare]|uniref:Uncharacterized protein n=1 Tax=Auriscalpium vulgare TaxID=40419 RepID=A0ACB8S1J1_9AGAM|nr:hypothetical protein FA95DRAFT_1588093 [Auriscalpium vulgare]